MFGPNEAQAGKYPATQRQQQSRGTPDGATNPNDGTPSPGHGDESVEWVEEMVASMSDQEFTKLQEEVERRLRGDGPADEEISESELQQDLFGGNRPVTRNIASV